MTPHERLRISIASAQYLAALERDDQPTLDVLCERAATDPELLEAFLDIDAAFLEEQQANELATATAIVGELAAQHLTSGEAVPPMAGPVTVADVARELFRHTPARLTADALQMNEKLRLYRDELPASLGLPSLIVWAEAKFGPAPADYWKAFREAAIKVRMRVNSDVEYQLAARRTKPRPEAS